MKWCDTEWDVCSPDRKDVGVFFGRIAFLFERGVGVQKETVTVGNAPQI